MAKNTVVPHAEQYLDANLNVLLIGLHGTGKTTSVLDLAQQKGLNVKLFTCSTLDVYTDLVGVPDPVVAADGQKELDFIRPREIDEAEFIFFDEINRADAKTLNAILEIIQFGTINGTPLPKLRCCWAAMNPPGLDYAVEDLDPALVDRFDVFEQVEAKPSVAYLAANGVRTHIAKVLVNWHKDHDKTRRDAESYLSPRRLHKIGLAYEIIGEKAVDKSIPKWIVCERAKLVNMLRQAEAEVAGTASAQSQGATIGSAPSDRITYDQEWIKLHAVAVSAILTQEQDNLATNNAVCEAIRKRHAGVLVRDYAEVLNAIRPSVLEAFIGSFADGKANTLADEITALPEARRQALSSLVSVVEADARQRN
jgi:hypothetical protein